MSSAVPIHPLVRLARQASSSLSGLPSTYTTQSRQSRLLSSSSRSLYPKPSRSTAARNSDSKSNAPQANLSPPTSSSSTPSKDDGKTSSGSIDSMPPHYYAASSRNKPVPTTPSVAAAASIKLIDNRKPQAQQSVTREDKQMKETKVEVQVREKVDGSKSTKAIKDEKGDASKTSKGASMHPMAVENDRRASRVAQRQDKASGSSNVSSTSIIDGNTGKSASSSTDGENTGKVTEGIFIPHHGETNSYGPSTTSSPLMEEAASSSTTPVSASGGSTGESFVPPRSEARARAQDGGIRPPTTTSISELGQNRPVNPLHPFDTHAFIKKLEAANFVAKRLGEENEGDDKNTDILETSLSTVRRHDPAEAIMEALRHLVVSRGERILDQHISKTEVDNQAYLFTAALSDLRTELQVRARNDAAALRSMVTLLQREVDGLNQKMREDTGAMKHDIQVDMNNRKSEAKEEQNTLEQEIQDLNNRFTISISDLKTEIEQNIKWDATRSALTVVFGCVVILIATLTAADHLTREEVSEDQNLQRRVTGGASRAPSDVLSRTATKSAEELGLVANYDEGDGSRFV